MEKILTVNDVAEILQVQPITVREMFRESRLRAFKVGKAWRTTESMLQEDLQALARGETPPPVPEAAKGATPGAAPKRKRILKPPAADSRPAPAPEAPPVESTPEPHVPPPAEDEAAAPKKKRERKAQEPDAAPDDTQQFLF